MTAVVIVEKGQNGKKAPWFQTTGVDRQSSEIGFHTDNTHPLLLCLRDDLGQIAFVSGFRRIDGNQNRIEVESLETPPVMRGS